ncbi:MAG TPA: hypothetical protein VMF69_21670 [Gemmataceae bacterium]|nr:hypothetical protein [Gemmataceae bacterium]
MRECPPKTRIAGRACGVLALLVTGCMPLGYVFPTVSYVRPATVGPARDQVHAFRVDVTDESNCFEIPEKDSYVLTPLPLNGDGSFEPQVKVATAYGWFLDGVTVIWGSCRHHTVHVRLYRPGYQTIDLVSWRNNEPLRWTPAATPQEQEQAVDDLVSTWWTSPMRVQTQYAAQGFEPPREPIVFRYLAPGSTSDEHREALGFAAREYERLARGVNDAELQARLAEKAKTLRQIVAR